MKLLSSSSAWSVVTCRALIIKLCWIPFCLSPLFLPSWYFENGIRWKWAGGWNMCSLTIWKLKLDFDCWKWRRIKRAWVQVFSLLFELYREMRLNPGERERESENLLDSRFKVLICWGKQKRPKKKERERDGWMDWKMRVNFGSLWFFPFSFGSQCCREWGKSEDQFGENKRRKSNIVSLLFLYFLSFQFKNCRKKKKCEGGKTREPNKKEVAFLGVNFWLSTFLLLLITRGSNFLLFFPQIRSISFPLYFLPLTLFVISSSIALINGL